MYEVLEGTYKIEFSTICLKFKREKNIYVYKLISKQSNINYIIWQPYNCKYPDAYLKVPLWYRQNSVPRSLSGPGK